MKDTEAKDFSFRQAARVNWTKRYLVKQAAGDQLVMILPIEASSVAKICEPRTFLFHVFKCCRVCC